MPTKTIYLTTEAYERLRRQRRGPGDSFSQVVLRARWNEDGVLAEELLEHWRDAPPFFEPEELDAIESAKQADSSPEDKWNRP